MTSSDLNTKSNHRLNGDSGFMIPVSFETLAVLVCISGVLFAVLALSNHDALFNFFRSDLDKVVDFKTKCPIGYDLAGPRSCSVSGLTWFMGFVGVIFVVNGVMLCFYWFEQSTANSQYVWTPENRTSANAYASSIVSASELKARNENRDQSFIFAKEVEEGDDVSFIGRRMVVHEIEATSSYIRLFPEVGPALVIAPRTQGIRYPTSHTTANTDIDEDNEVIAVAVEPDEQEQQTDVVPAVPETLYESPDEVQGKFRECPYCAEPIRARAVICRFCNNKVDPFP